MHPLIAYDLAKIKMNDLHAEADRERLAATARTARTARREIDREPLIPARWALRRFFAKLHLAGSGA
jgi:hypothetical protein